MKPIYHNVDSSLNRALWQAMLLGFKQLDPSSELVQQIVRSGLLDVAMAAEPRIHVDGPKVYCNDLELDLTGSEMTLRVFQAFLVHPGQRLDREELVHRVYGLKNWTSFSLRRQESLKHSVVKLISRARRAARAAFVAEDIQAFEWFPYDTYSGKWRLIKYRENDGAAFAVGEMGTSSPVPELA